MLRFHTFSSAAGLSMVMSSVHSVVSHRFLSGLDVFQAQLYLEWPRDGVVGKILVFLSWSDEVSSSHNLDFLTALTRMKRCPSFSRDSVHSR